MASQTEPITTYDVPDYTGAAFIIAATGGKAPLMGLAGTSPVSDPSTPGGVSIGDYRIVTSSQFSMGNAITLDAATQSGISEDDTLAPSTNTSFAAAQGTNYVQNFQYLLTDSWNARALNGYISGVPERGPSAGIANINTQIKAVLGTLMQNLEYSALRGTAQAWTTAATAGAMGGLLTAIEAGSETSADSASISPSLLDTELVRMQAAGAEFTDIVLACNGFQYTQMMRLFSNAVPSTTEGGVDIQTIYLPIAGKCKLVLEPVLATDDILLVDMAHFKPVFGVVPGMPPVSISPLARKGAADQWQVFSMASIDYDSIAFHGAITGLATS